MEYLVTFIDPLAYNPETVQSESMTKPVFADSANDAIKLVESFGYIVTNVELK